MEKKKILFVIHRLDAGGAEKSLVSLLNSLPLEKFEVDLLALDPTGIFRDNLPDGLRFVNPPGGNGVPACPDKRGAVLEARHIQDTVYKAEVHHGESCARKKE